MAENNDDIPPIPVPPTASAVPPVEPPPTAPPAPPTAPPAPPAAPPAPVAPEPLPPASAARPDPYAAAGAYAQPGAAPAPQAYPQPGYAPGAVPPAYGAPGYGYAPAAPAQGLSLASMIVGIAAVFASFVSLGLLPSIAAVILGHLGQRRQPYARPFWLTGLITGYIALGISLIWGVYFIAIIIAGIAASTSSY